MMLELIHNRVDYCTKQRRLDMALSALSFGTIAALLVYCYGYQLGLILPFLFLAVVVHSMVMFYCYRLWSLRISKWNSMERGLQLMESVQELFTETGELRSSLLRSADIAAGILRSRPILS